MEEQGNNIKFVYILVLFVMLAGVGFYLSDRGCSPSSPYLCWTPDAFEGDAAKGQVAPVYYHARGRAWHLLCDAACRAPAECYYYCCGGDTRADQSGARDSSCSCQLPSESAWFGDMGPGACATGYEGNFRALLKNAATGDAQTQLLVASFYESGRNDDPKPDLKEAFFWYRSAAGKGSLRAQYKLGQFYEQGKGVTADCKQAVSWYTKAGAGKADPGDLTDSLEIMSARGRLGDIFEQGSCGPVDYAQAVRWYKLAVESQGQWSPQDDEPAATHLGDIYMKGGNGVARNAADAIRWYRAAAETPNSANKARAEYELSMIYAKGDDVEQDFITACHWYALAGRDPRYQSRNICDPIEPYLNPGDLDKLYPLISVGGLPK